MPSSTYIAIRLHPDSPVDAGVFGSSYLKDLQIQVYPASVEQKPANLLGETNIAPSNLTISPIPFLANANVVSVTKTVQSPTIQQGSNDYGKSLDVSDPDGIPFGATVTCQDNSKLFNSNTTVNNIPAAANPTTIGLSQSIPNPVDAGTTVSFFFVYGENSPGITLDWNPNNPSFQFQLNTSAAANNSTTVNFTPTDGIAVGMQVTAPSGIPSNTTVLSVAATSITLSNAVTLAHKAAVTFTSSLSSGIVQHTEPFQIDVPFGTIEVPIPASVATAVIEINPQPPANTYLDITVVATRTGVSIPVNNDFYDVYFTQGPLPTLDQYQSLPPSLYITLPAPPQPNTISLDIPTDGSAPEWSGLFGAMKQALDKDPFFQFTGDPLQFLANLSTTQCTRMAYDIVWGQQTNALPAPPDPIESLYTNPPNPGGSTGNNGTNNLEQDRQKFEGTISSFYSTRNATAERLSKFVAAASAALFCEQTSLNSTAALLEFPVDPSSTNFAAAVESELIVQGLGGSASSDLSFGVPAAFFYALGANLEKSTKAAQRFQSATGDAIERLLQQFATAESTGAIDGDSQKFASDPSQTITSFQAARRLVALRISAASNSPSATVVAGSPLASLIKDWRSQTDPTPTPPLNPPLSYQQIDFNIWTKTLGTADPLGYLYLDLDALTQGFVIPSSTSTLADKIVAWLPSVGLPQTVDGLKKVSAKQWTDFFTANPSWLPPFTQPAALSNSTSVNPPKAGYIAARIRAFIRAVQQFFTVSTAVTQAPLPQAGAPPVFELPSPSNDRILLAVQSLPGTFTFGSTLSATDLTSAVQNVFPNDLAAQAWLTDAMIAINDLYTVASVVPNPATLPNPVSFAFSIAEALYARGFRSAKDITRLSGDDFQQAMTGTIAYDYANSGSNSLYQKARAIAPNSPSSVEPGGGFQPINADGSLVNCVPPPCLSPLGPISYLQEMLQVSQASTCGNPFATPGTGQITLGDAMAARRGPVGNLLASCANLETPLPLIDIVNESLEYLGATNPPSTSGGPGPSGTVYDTSADELAGYVLCKEGDCEDKEDRRCHEPDAIYAALPEYSTPATPVKGKNDSVEPLVYNYLRSDFSTCHLPYSQALDVSRTYLRHFGACRFEELRTFRKCITEFALDPANPPVGFQSHLWRYPVRIETAIEYLGITPEEYTLLFQGTPAQSCGIPIDRAAPRTAPVPVPVVYGFSSSGDKPTVSLDTISLVASSCGYYRGQIEHHAAP
jgi:hypothetical protein